MPRYIVRRQQGASRYAVWDNETNSLATYQGRECADIDFDDAFKAVDALNAEHVMWSPYK